VTNYLLIPTGVKRKAMPAYTGEKTERVLNTPEKDGLTSAFRCFVARFVYDRSRLPSNIY